jgi:hypothetical protein
MIIDMVVQLAALLAGLYAVATALVFGEFSVGRKKNARRFGQPVVEVHVPGDFVVALLNLALVALLAGRAFKVF